MAVSAAVGTSVVKAIPNDFHCKKRNRKSRCSNVIDCSTKYSTESCSNVLSRETRGSSTLVVPAAAFSCGPVGDYGWSGIIGSNIMEEDYILLNLDNSLDKSKHVEAVRALRSHMLCNGGKVMYRNRRAVFVAVARMLEASGNDSSSKAVCIQVISEILQNNAEDVNQLRTVVLPVLISSLQDESPMVRKELVQTLHKCLKHAENPQDVFQALIDYGLEAEDSSVRTATTVILPILLTKETLRVDLFDVTTSLVKKLNGNNGLDDPVVAFSTLEQIRQHVGQDEFGSYLKRLPPSLRRAHSSYMEMHFEQLANINGKNHTIRFGNNYEIGSIGPTVAAAQRDDSPDNLFIDWSYSKNNSNLKFHIIPQELYCRLLDQNDYKLRTHAVEELKHVVGDFNFSNVPSTSCVGFIGFLCNLLEDSNFKVVCGALEILNVLVIALNRNVEEYLKPIVSATVKVLGDNKVVTKQECMKVFMGLMKTVGPQKVLDCLLENIKHKNSSVREEVINIIIASLLTYPSEDFDLVKLCFAVSPSLIDSKRKVRNAALEAFAVFASSLGVGKLQPIFQAVDKVELQENVDGVMNAVHARLARKTLPKLTPQGLVEYAVPVTSSVHGRGQQLYHGADTEWLLASGRTQSAHSYHGDQENDFLQGFGLQTSHTDEQLSHRRVLSAGKGKNRFPWENNNMINDGIHQASWITNTTPAEQHSDVPPPPQSKPSHTVPASDDLFFTRKPVLRNMMSYDGLDFTNANSAGNRSSTGNVETYQPRISGKKGLLGYSRMYAKSGSVDSDLQFLGISQFSDKASLHTSISLSSKVQRAFYSPVQTERTSSFPSSASSQGAFILPSYPLSSPRTSPKHNDPTDGIIKKAQDQNVNFSNSWPNKQFEKLQKPSPQKKSSSQKLEGITGEDKQSPIPIKPALVRSASSRRGLSGTKPVPPIPRGASPLPDKETIIIADQKKEENYQEPDNVWLNESEKEKKLELDLSELSVQDEDLEEMISSLRSLRNSAAKKRAKLGESNSDLESPDSAVKLDLTTDSPSHASSPVTSPYSESGVSSQGSLTSPSSTLPLSWKTMNDHSSPFGSKPHLVRSSSGKMKPPVVEYNPNSGVTFRDNSTSDVSIIGQRMNYGSGTADIEEEKCKELIFSTVVKSQVKEQQKSSKFTKGLTGSVASVQMNNHDTTGHSLSDDSVVIVGKGVFGSPPSFFPLNSNHMVVSTADSIEDLSVMKQNMKPPAGIYGKAVQQNSQANNDSTENERDIKFTLSKSAQEKMRQKKKEDKEMSVKEQQESKEDEKKQHHLRERLKNIDTEKVTEELSITGDVLFKPKTESLPSENPIFSPPPLKRSSSIRKTKSSVSPNSGELSPGSKAWRKDRTSMVAHSPEIIDPADLHPFSKPELAQADALRFLVDDDWERKIEGLNFIRCLSAYHSAVLMTKLHETVLAVIQEVKNLRSGVSRAAVVCLADMFTHLKKNMDQDLDATVKVLLHKAGEPNTFIREDVDKALNAMVTNVTPARALSSLINGGLSHLHTAVRKCTAQHLFEVVERMGPGRLLSGIKDVTDRILPAAAKFAQDSSQETRYYGRKMLETMMSYQDFDKILEKYLSPKDLPYIKETVNNIRQKGVGEPDTPSAKGRRSHPGSGGSMRVLSNSRDTQGLLGRDIVDVRDIAWKPTPRKLIENAEYVKELTSLLNSKDFRDRIRGIDQLMSDCLNDQDLVASNIIKIFDAFKSRLHDSNSKVNQIALETLHKMIPLLRENLTPVVNMMVPAVVDNNLNSKNPGIYAAAISVIDALIQHLDNSLLLQTFCTKAQFLNGKAKHEMTEKVADLVTLYPVKPQAVEQKVLPVLWNHLGNIRSTSTLPATGGNIRTATAKLAKALFAQMGPSLLEQAASQPPHIKKTLEELLEVAT
ncbi:TOG array regulator of axonemal microtubules protein 1 isoform X2 [Protopterus annectens]|uniref:TOG array regulator of axonemal microtubules protein 1 isoform X2 n=1 Tax=Protopterus annectens TaxID=7888 RepID=UPI001CFA87C5|nr:TOG array regulator of axonemal microtubules protein 1 isoform X2 [Protopterus annectens]